MSEKDIVKARRAAYINGAASEYCRIANTTVVPIHIQNHHKFKAALLYPPPKRRRLVSTAIIDGEWNFLNVSTNSRGEIVYIFSNDPQIRPSDAATLSVGVMKGSRLLADHIPELVKAASSVVTFPLEEEEL